MRTAAIRTISVVTLCLAGVVAPVFLPAFGSLRELELWPPKDFHVDFRWPPHPLKSIQGEWNHVWRPLLQPDDE